MYPAVAALIPRRVPQGHCTEASMCSGRSQINDADACSCGQRGEVEVEVEVEDVGLHLQFALPTFGANGSELEQPGLPGWGEVDPADRGCRWWCRPAS